jgi:hypothetical protein
VQKPEVGDGAIVAKLVQEVRWQRERHRTQHDLRIERFVRFVQVRVALRRTNSAGRTSWCAAIGRSAAIGSWSAARSASAGAPGSTTRPPRRHPEHQPHRHGSGPGEKRRRAHPTATPVLAGGAATGARVAGPVDLPPPLLARLVRASPSTARPAPAAGRRRRRPTPVPLPPGVTK